MKVGREQGHRKEVWGTLEEDMLDLETHIPAPVDGMSAPVNGELVWEDGISAPLDGVHVLAPVDGVHG